MTHTHAYAFDLTVITVCWNAASTLQRCIQSVAPLLTNSDDLRVEYLIVDGNSTDGTVELLEAALQQGKISRYISEPDKGIYDAMNKATRLAKGRICVFINADDEICADAAKACSQPILEGRARYTAASAVTMKNNVPSGIWVPDMKLAWLGVAYCHQSMYCECSLLQEYGGFDTSYRIAADAHMINSLYRDKIPFEIVPVEASRFYLGGASTVDLVVQREQLRVMFAFADVIFAHCTNDSDYAQFALKKIMHRINAANLQSNDDQIHQEKLQMINLHEKIADTLPINLRKKMRKNYLIRCWLYKALGICCFCSPKSAKKNGFLAKHTLKWRKNAPSNSFIFCINTTSRRNIKTMYCKIPELGTYSTKKADEMITPLSSPAESAPYSFCSAIYCEIFQFCTNGHGLDISLI